MSWAWSIIPARLIDEQAFLDLPMIDRGLLYALYHRCDKWGCGPAQKAPLARAVGVMDGMDALFESLQRLRRAGYVEISPCGSAWRLPKYDEDSPAELLRRRGAATRFAVLFGNDSRRQAAPDDVPQPHDVACQLPDDCQTPPDNRQPQPAKRPGDDSGTSAREERQRKRAGKQEGGRRNKSQLADLDSNDSRRQAAPDDVPQPSDVAPPQTETETVPYGNRISRSVSLDAGARSSPPLGAGRRDAASPGERVPQGPWPSAAELDEASERVATSGSGWLLDPESVQRAVRDLPRPGVGRFVPKSFDELGAVVTAEGLRLLLARALAGRLEAEDELECESALRWPRGGRGPSAWLDGDRAVVAMLQRALSGEPVPSPADPLEAFMAKLGRLSPEQRLLEALAQAQRAREGKPNFAAVPEIKALLDLGRGEVH